MSPLADLPDGPGSGLPRSAKVVHLRGRVYHRINGLPSGDDARGGLTVLIDYTHSSARGSALSVLGNDAQRTDSADRLHPQFRARVSTVSPWQRRAQRTDSADRLHPQFRARISTVSPADARSSARGSALSVLGNDARGGLTVLIDYTHSSARGSALSVLPTRAVPREGQHYQSCRRAQFRARVSTVSPCLAFSSLLAAPAH